MANYKTCNLLFSATIQQLSLKLGLSYKIPPNFNENFIVAEIKETSELDELLHEQVINSIGYVKTFADNYNELEKGLYPKVYSCQRASPFGVNLY